MQPFIILIQSLYTNLLILSIWLNLSERNQCLRTADNLENFVSSWATNVLARAIAESICELTRYAVSCEAESKGNWCSFFNACVQLRNVDGVH